MENKNLKLLEAFISSKNDEYISGEQLSYLLNVSKRSITSYIKRINEYSEEGCFKIECKRGTGYKLVIEDNDKFVQWFDDIENIDENEVKRRQISIFYKLIINESYVNIYDLADELNISASLARKDIKALMPLIKKYNLELKHSYSHGYLIVGEEKDIRKAISKEYPLVKEDGLSFDVYQSNNQILDAITNSLDKYLKKYNMAFSKKSLDSLVIHLLIAINRIETDNPIKINNVYDKNTVEYQVASLVNKDIEKIFNTTLSDDEVYYFSQHLKSNASLFNELVDIENINNEEVIVFYNIFLREIYRYSNINFFDDENLKSNLLKHIVLFLHRLKNDNQIEKTNLSKIKDEFPYALELSIHGLKTISKKYDKYISEAETLYFAIHLALALESINTPRKYNIAVIMDESEALFRLITHRLNNEIQEKINVIQLFRFKDLVNEKLNDFDLIINATDNKLWYDKPIVNIKDYLSDNDIVNVSKCLSILDNQNDIERLMNKELYFVMEYETKDEVIKNLIKAIANVVDIDEEKFYHSVMSREQYGSTAFGNKIAIPHPLDTANYPNFISICRLRKPVLWNDKQIQIVFLFSLNGANSTTKLFLDELSKIILNDKKALALNKTKNFEDFKNEFFKKY